MDLTLLEKTDLLLEVKVPLLQFIVDLLCVKNPYWILMLNLITTLKRTSGTQSITQLKEPLSWHFNRNASSNLILAGDLNVTDIEW